MADPAQKTEKPPGRASREPQQTAPLPPEVARELVLGDRDIESALATPSRCRVALTRMAVAILERRLDPKLANAVTQVIYAASHQNRIEMEQATREREFALKEREIEVARELAIRLEEFRAQAPPQLVQAVQVHMPALLREGAEGVQASAQALEHEGEVRP